MRVLNTGYTGEVIEVLMSEYRVRFDSGNDEWFYEYDIEEIPASGPLVIVAHLVFGSTGGLKWEYGTGHYSEAVLAYGWSDGVMTWKEERDGV